MSGQCKISSFFSPSAVKRTAKDAGIDEKSNEKMTKIVSPPPSSEHEEKLSLSPEQKERIEKNRQEAQMKLLSKKGPENFGLSWKKALVAEFDKEYFQKVDVIVILQFVVFFFEVNSIISEKIVM